MACAYLTLRVLHLRVIHETGAPLIVEQAAHFDRVARLALLVELVERALHEERELLGAHAVHALLDIRRVQRPVSQKYRVQSATYEYTLTPKIVAFNHYIPVRFKQGRSYHRGMGAIAPHQ